MAGRVNGCIVSSGPLIDAPTAVVAGNILAESLVLLGTIFGNIKAYKPVRLGAISTVYGHISYGELSLEGALHEGSSHKLSEEEIEAARQECLAILEESANSVEKSHPDEAAMVEFTSSVAVNAEKQTNTLLGKKQDNAGTKKHHHHHGRSAHGAKSAPADKRPEAAPASNAAISGGSNGISSNGGAVTINKAEGNSRPAVKRSETPQSKDGLVKKSEPVAGNGPAAKKSGTDASGQQSVKAEPVGNPGQAARKENAAGLGERAAKAEPLVSAGQTVKKDNAAGPGGQAVKKAPAVADNGQAVKKSEAPPKTWESIKKPSVAPQNGTGKAAPPLTKNED